jgi:hypothetical protein
MHDNYTWYFSTNSNIYDPKPLETCATCYIILLVKINNGEMWNPLIQVKKSDGGEVLSNEEECSE